jgi:hypothetical protein
MAKNKVTEWSSTASSNTDIGGIDINEGCAPSGINNAIRTMMAQIKDLITGAGGEDQTVGGNLTVNGTTTLVGDATAPTQASSDNSTKLATTAFVKSITSLLGSMSTQNSNSVDITGGSISGITDLAVGDGGTGASSFTSNNVVLGNGSSALNGNMVAPSTAGNVLMSDGTTWYSAPIAGGLGVNQTWQTPSRTTSTSYRNTTGKPIMVAVSAGGTGQPYVQVSSDNSSWINVGHLGFQAYNSCSFIVPDGWYYRIDGSAGSLTWAELR